MKKVDNNHRKRELPIKGRVRKIYEAEKGFKKKQFRKT